MPLLTDEELKAFPEPTTADVVPHYVARYWDLMALADHQPARVIGADAILKDRPGFDVELLTRGSIPEDPYEIDRHEVLMVMRGHWRLAWSGGETVLAPGRHLRRAPGSPAQPDALHDGRSEPLPRPQHARSGRADDAPLNTGPDARLGAKGHGVPSPARSRQE